MSYAHANITFMQMAELDVSQAQLSAFSGVNINKINPWLAGTRDLSNVELEKINDTIKSLRRLVELAQPWPINFRRVGDIKSLLERMKYGEFDKVAEVGSAV